MQDEEAEFTIKANLSMLKDKSNKISNPFWIYGRFKGSNVDQSTREFHLKHSRAGQRDYRTINK